MGVAHNAQPAFTTSAQTDERVMQAFRLQREVTRFTCGTQPPEGTIMATEFAQRDYAHSEGQLARAIEEQTAKLPSDAFLWLAVGSMAAAATMQIMGNKQGSLFVGQWAPTFLIFGLYNKLVKQLGSDRTENAV
jgi:hypothetical protein